MVCNSQRKKISKPYQIGELTFYGKNVSSGYSYKFSDLNKFERKKILYTGDLAYFDKEKFFYIKGRKNRIFKIYGNRINLDEVEFRMKKQNYDVVLKEVNKKLNVFFEKNYSKNKIQKNLNEIIGQNILQIKFTNLKKFPRTNSGKINYKKLNSYA